MGFFKSADEKAAIKEQKARDRYLRSPIGRATSAYDRGDSLLQIDLPVDDSGSTTISEIEAVGWRLDMAGYTFALSLGSTSNVKDQLSSIHSSGSLTGIYLFRRA